MFAELPARVGGEEENVGTRTGGRFVDQLVGARSHRGVVVLLVVEPQQSDARGGAPRGKFLHGGGGFEQRAGRVVIFGVDGQQPGFDRSTRADRGIFGGLGKFGELPESTIGQTGARIGVGQFEKGALAIRVVGFLRGHVTVGREGLELAVGPVERPSLVELRHHPQFRVAHVVRRGAESFRRRVIVLRGVLHLSEAVGAGSEEFPRAEFGDEALKSGQSLGVAFERAQALGQTEKRRLALGSRAALGQELLILRHREVIHLLRVETVALFEQSHERIGHDPGRQRADFTRGNRFGRGDSGSRRDGRNNGENRHGDRRRGLGGSGDRKSRRHGANRLGAAHFGLRLRRSARGQEEQDYNREKFHDSGRPVAKATFQMFAPRQTSSTATM